MLNMNRHGGPKCTSSFVSFLNAIYRHLTHFKHLWVTWSILTPFNAT